MKFISVETELTTAFTDLLLALLCISAFIAIARSALFEKEKKRLSFWLSGFICLAVAGMAGFLAHGFELNSSVGFVAWQVINLCLGLTVAFFAIGVMMDLVPGRVSVKTVAIMLSITAVFYCVTLVFPDSFFVFTIYEGIAMIFSVSSYLYLWCRYRYNYSLLMAAGMSLSILAAVLQLMDNLSFRLVWEFDHNGIFHLIQIPGIIFLLKGALIPRN
jgi:hypothetical protein